MALFLSFLLLSSQVGFAVSVHYCGDKIADSSISLLQEELSCGMEASTSICESMPTADQVSEKSCCQNRSQLVQLEDDFNQKNSVSTTNISLVQVFTLVANEIVTIDQTVVSEFQVPPSPLVRSNPQVLFQTFLI